MTINAKQLKNAVVIPALKHIDLCSPAAVNLVMGTIAHESAMATYLQQVKGPALGICQMEPATHRDIYENFLKYRPRLRTRLAELTSDLYGATPFEMVGNLRYSVAMCRVHYFRVPHSLPEADDVLGMARYWKRWYNTALGAGTEGQFVEAYEEHIA